MIIFLNKLNDYWNEKIEGLREKFPDVRFIPVRDENNKEKYLAKASGIVASKITVEEINKAVNAKILFVPFTGVNFFPLKELKRENFIVANAHGSSKFVAERALTLALTLLGRIIEYHNDLSRGYWHMYEGMSGQWTSIHDMVCGILGVGHVGRNLAKLLKAFNCTVIGFKKHKIKKNIKYIDEITNNLNEVIDKSDIVFICLPETYETKGIIDNEILSKMKGKYLINVGRGSIIKEEALYNNLINNTLSGAGFDVWYNYPKGKKEKLHPSNYPIYKLRNVVITPHNAGNTYKARKLNIDETIKNIVSYLKKGKPVTEVNLKVGY